MDKNRARFLLSCFRPDGADADDPAFAEALRLAAADRELGEWLARERAYDAAFAAALASVAIPDDLRDAILACLAGGRNNVPQAVDALDTRLIGALASCQPPGNLRADVIAAMERSAAARRRRLAPRWWLVAPLAAAASVAIAWLAWPEREAPADTVYRDSSLPVAAVEAGFIRAFESPQLRFDIVKAEQERIIDHLKRRELPYPEYLPPGLRNAPSMACRELVIDGKRGAMIRFEQHETGVVHLVVFRREDVNGDLPGDRKPEICKHGRWAVASWADADHVFVLLGNTDSDKLAGLF